MVSLDQNLYIFSLGRVPELSFMELKGLMSEGDQMIGYEDGFYALSLSKPLSNPQGILNILGGTIKISKVLSELRFPVNTLTETACAVITHRILEKFASSSSKIVYGISVHNLHAKSENILKNSLKNIKKFLTENGRSSRFVNKDFQNVHNVIVVQEKMIDKGLEASIIKIGEKIYITETVAIQDFESYEHRDFNRPARNMDSGMLPPKTAQIMINLSGINKFDSSLQNKSPVIYDPFCGNGTILCEALLMGAEVVGSDKAEKAIKDTQININWLSKEYELQEPKSYIFAKDINDLKASDLPDKIDAIIGESYLGPRLLRKPTLEEIAKISAELETLYVATLKKLAELKIKCPIILALAAFRDKFSYRYIESIPEKALEFGFTIAPLSPKKRSSLIYDRPDQFVAREIFCFQLK
ncbi:MAG: methylase protein [Candidatus Peregrinibacteria bacterium GW2011_GWC2_39_14]|nr:MAG: methylase protein [Candidatus Peregrinibacteria bacterium GW2011_GWC2_39_14]